jgi:hypothetical protein
MSVAEVWSKNLKGIDYLEDLGMEGRVISK